MFALAGATFFALWFVVAPYGRHARAGWGPTISDRVGWAAMESPSLVYFSWIFFHGAHHDRVVPLALWALWTAHYAHRAIVYPLRLARRGRRMPIAIAAMAFSFNVLNATINASFIGALGAYPDAWLASGPFVVGALLFALGMTMNLEADRKLLALRRSSPDGYAIPRGGMHELVSCPNYLGEMIEWGGWALASASMGGLAFFVYTIANLAPRAFANHAWYRRTFPDYPRARRALVPFVW